MSAKRMVIVGGIRTAIGKINGSLAGVPAEYLLAYCFRDVVKKSGIDPAQIDSVIVGNICTPTDAVNIARVAALRAKIPNSVPAWTVGQNCASGIRALTDACYTASAGDGEIFLVGATESMSRAPYVLKDARIGLKLMHYVLTDSIWEGLTDSVIGKMMGTTAENIVKKWAITREEQDNFAVNSHRKTLEAQKQHLFDDQIYPISIQNRVRIHKSGSADKIFVKSQVNFSQDESPNRKLVESPSSASLVPAIFLNEHIYDPVSTKRFIDKKNEDGMFAFVIEQDIWDEGAVTSANSCPLNDGAAAMLVMTEEKAASLGLTPLAQVVSHAYTGCDPEFMGEGPIKAVPKALARAGLNMGHLDAVELNEAFAAQSIACQRVLEIPDEVLNIWGGAIALGHPVGATGLILVVKAMHILKHIQKRYAAITMCIGGGQGGCVIIERV